MGLENSNHSNVVSITDSESNENLIKEPLLPLDQRGTASDRQEYSQRDEIVDLMRKFAGETMASFVVVFTVCAVGVNTNGGGAAASLATSVLGGLAVMVAIFSIGHVSGSHINPTVTVSQTAINHFPLRLAPMYISAHVVGGILASVAVEFLYSPEESLLLVAPKTTALHSFFAEMVGGFILLFVASSVYTDARAIGEFAGIAVGTAIAIDLIAIGPVSGGGVNPARALGPAFARWRFDKDLWAFVVGPCVGGVMGAFLYRLLRKGDSITKFKFQKATDAILCSADSSTAGKRLSLRRNASSS